MTSSRSETPCQPPFRRSRPVLLFVFLLAVCLAADISAPARAGEHMPNMGGDNSFTAAVPPDRQHSGSAATVVPAGDGPKRLERLPDVFQGMMVPGLARDSDCTPPEQIRRRLKLQGWWDFDRLERAGDKFRLRARRPNGTAYQLTIDGCSGRVLGAMRLNAAERGYRLWPR